MSEPSIEDVLRRLDDVFKEVRRQGRAAVSAQAAAESCLEAVQTLSAQRGEMRARTGRVEELNGSDDAEVRWLRALVPVADAVERVLGEAADLAARQPPPRRGLLRFLLGAQEEDSGATALVEGLRVLDEQMKETLGALGAVVDRPIGARVDPERHRVVGVLLSDGEDQAGTILEVVRPGYALGPVVVREAEVVVVVDARGRARGAEGDGRGAGGDG